jgi:Type ISP C-terminal specificity domain
LWKAASGKQAYLTALRAHSPSSGPALTVAGHIPELDHYHGRGGRVFPLWADAATTEPNMPLALLTELSAIYGRVVGGPDLFAYIAAVAASPAYSERFRVDLRQPGLRVPITAQRAVFDEAVKLGREVVWLHTFGERFGEGRPPGPPRVDKDEPTIPARGALPDALAAMPHDLDYDAASRKLKGGLGLHRPCPPRGLGLRDIWQKRAHPVVELSAPGPFQAPDGRQAAAFKAKRNSADNLAGRIYDRASRPLARPHPVDRFGAATGRSTDSHRGGPDDR